MWLSFTYDDELQGWVGPKLREMTNPEQLTPELHSNAWWEQSAQPGLELWHAYM